MEQMASDDKTKYGLGLKYADKAATAALIFEALDGNSMDAK